MINMKMNITEVISDYPSTIEIFLKHGMGCLGCAAARFENIEDGALAHGIDVTALINDLNNSIAEESNRGY
jgi:hybrid cluster-associated redox disulfide protein